MQNFFINGRFVRSRTAMAALEEACKGMVMVGKFPGCVLHIGLSFRAVDVNVHPAKIEVRFVNEKPIFEAVYYGVKSALVEGDTVKSFKLDTQNPFDNLIDSSVVQKPYTMSQYTVQKIKNEPIVRPSQREQIDRTAVKNYNAMLADISKTVDEEKQSADDDKRHEQEILEHYRIDQSEKKPVQLNNSASYAKGLSYANIDIIVEEEVAEVPVKEINSEQTALAENNDTENIETKNDTSEKIDIDENITNEAPENKIENSDKIIPIISDEDGKIKYIGEAFATYIIVEKESEIVMVDKHALHERIIYERLKREQGKKFAQYLLEPVAVTLSRQQYVGILEQRDLMFESGFEIDDFGGSTILVRSAPSFIDAFDIPSTVEEMADHILDNKNHNIACRSAIKGGDKSSPEELFELYKTMEKDPNYRYCPHGRPTSITISKYQIEKQFGRIQ